MSLFTCLQLLWENLLTLGTLMLRKNPCRARPRYCNRWLYSSFQNRRLSRFSFNVSIKAPFQHWDAILCIILQQLCQEMYERLLCRAHSTLCTAVKRFSLEAAAIPPHLTLMEFEEFCFNNFNLIFRSFHSPYFLWGNIL